MAKPGPQAQGIAAPNLPPPLQDQPEPQAPQQPARHTQHVVHMNRSHFKTEFSEKPEEDAEAHLLHTKDWMNAHHFIEGVKV